MSIYDRRDQAENEGSKIKMVEVPEFNPSIRRRDEGDKTSDQKGGETMKNPLCQVHGEKMEQIGESKRGVPEFYCSKGCKLEMGEGRVKTVKEEKGFGFIKVDGGKDVFCHVSEMNGAWPPQEGDLVRFKVGLNPVCGKLQAVDITNLSADGRN